MAGGNGFIGSRVVRMLVDSGAREIVILGRGKSHATDSCAHYASCDLAENTSVQKIKTLGAFDYVFNLIGVTDQKMPHPNPAGLFDANVKTLIHLTQGIAWEYVRGAVHAGSNIEYGAQPVAHREDMNPSPANAYGWSKASASSYARMMTTAGFAKWCVARPFFVYGPGKQTGFIPELIKTLARGGTFTVNGAATRDPVYVDDVAEGLVRLATCSAATGEIVNICRGKEVSIMKIAEMTQHEIGKGKIIFQSEYRPGDIPRSCGSIRKLKSLTGWTPSVTLSVGLMRIPKETA